ncbi:hypothetical protein JW890_06265 [candidate division WOR-3 bacterium]|nr:hypothetical protein [candidate division WOR-3 bacterium]
MKKEEVEIFKKLFETAKWEEALRFSEKLPEEDLSKEFRSIVFFNINQKKRGEDISSELIKEYIKRHDFFECLAFMETMRVFSKKNYRNYFKVQNRILIQAKFWSGLLDVVRDVFVTYGNDVEGVSQYIESLKQYAGQNPEVLGVFEDITTIVKTKKMIETATAKNTAEGLDFSVPKYLEKIGSNENAAYSYIKLAKRAIELKRYDEVKNSIDALERLGYGGLMEVKELKKTIESTKDTAHYGPTERSVSELVVNYIDGIFDKIPFEAPENHIKFAHSLYGRALYEQTKNEYLYSVLTYPEEQRRTYIENLFSELANNDIEWANEVMDFFHNSGKVNKEEISSIKVQKQEPADKEVLDLTREIMSTMEKVDFLPEKPKPDESTGTIGIYTKAGKDFFSEKKTSVENVSDKTEKIPGIKNGDDYKSFGEGYFSLKPVITEKRDEDQNKKEIYIYKWDEKTVSDNIEPSQGVNAIPTGESSGEKFPGFSLPEKESHGIPEQEEETEDNIDFL